MVFLNHPTEHPYVFSHFNQPNYPNHSDEFTTLITYTNIPSLPPKCTSLFYHPDLLPHSNQPNHPDVLPNLHLHSNKRSSSSTTLTELTTQMYPHFYHLNHPDLLPNSNQPNHPDVLPNLHLHSNKSSTSSTALLSSRISG